MHWEGEDLSGWQVMESFGIAPQMGGEPLKGSPQGSAVTSPAKWDQDPVTALGASQPGGWGLDRLALRQCQNREGWVLIHGVWATSSQAQRMSLSLGGQAVWLLSRLMSLSLMGN